MKKLFKMPGFLFLCFICCLTAAAQETSQAPITVFIAKKIITMDPARPVATAVAVRNGQILSVGSLQELQPWLQNQRYTLVDTFKNKILMPGFIDPHAHPMLGAIQLATVWITPEPWNILGTHIPATQGHAAYMQALRTAFKNDTRPKNQPFITWGYSHFYHGSISRADLDALSTTRPIVVWERSTHQAYFNTPALNALEISEAQVKNNPNIDWAKGFFFEEGFIRFAAPRMLSHHFITAAAVHQGYLKARRYFQANGITTVCDMATGIINWDAEIQELKTSFDNTRSPVRVFLVPDPVGIATSSKMDAHDVLTFIQHCSQDNSDHLRCGKAIKLFADGAIFSQMMQMKPPGYIDGHSGVWITPPETFATLAKSYWDAGFQIHVHTNGDQGVELVLNTLEALQAEKPRFDHRFTIEHYGYATDNDAERIANLGAIVSANPFYLYDLADKYSTDGLGYDRAARITPLGGLVKRGVPVSIHSDFAMAPAQPLLLAQIAATRQTLSGKIDAPAERLSREEALRAITITAAYILHQEDSLGSIAAGKIADFSVLEQDPMTVPLTQLGSIPLWGTIYEGKPFKTIG
jgi:predicted amidohydrolase YtcJ